MSTMGFKIFQPRRRGVGEKRWSRIGNTVIRTSAGWWVCGGSLYYLLHFCKCLTFFHYKKFVVFLFVSLEREKKKIFCLNCARCLVTINPTCTQRFPRLSLRTYSTSDLLSLIHLINILSNLVSLNLAQFCPAHIAGPIWIDPIPPLRECNSPTIMSSIHLWGHHIAQHWGLIFSSILLMFF